MKSKDFRDWGMPTDNETDKERVYGAFNVEVSPPILKHHRAQRFLLFFKKKKKKTKTLFYVVTLGNNYI